MPGNDLARRSLADARARGESVKDVYNRHTSGLEDLSPERRAWVYGYVSCLIECPVEANPYSPDNPMHGDWNSGWSSGQTGDFSALAWHLHVTRGGD